MAGLVRNCIGMKIDHGGAEGRRDRGTEGQRGGGTEGRRGRGTEGQRDRGTEGQRKPNLPLGSLHTQ